MGAHHAIAPNVCWAMDFQFDQTIDTRPLKILNIIDEYSRECLASFVARSITAADVVAILDDLLSQRARPIYLRCDNGGEFIANVVADWSSEVGTTLWFIEPGSPWQNGRVESFNGRLRDEMLNGELFESVKEAQVLLDRWRIQYNTYRPHSSLGRLAPEQFLAKDIQEQRRLLRKSSRSRGWLRRKELLAA